jgi:toxin ParE1/3/4
MNAGYGVAYTDEAVDDLRGIYRYIAFRLLEPVVAENLINRIREKVRDLGMFPKKYRLVSFEPMRSCGMRQVSVDNFIVFYLTDDENKTVAVARVLYGKRDIKKQFGQ